MAPPGTAKADNSNEGVHNLNWGCTGKVCPRGRNWTQQGQPKDRGNSLRRLDLEAGDRNSWVLFNASEWMLGYRGLLHWHYGNVREVNKMNLGSQIAISRWFSMNNVTMSRNSQWNVKTTAHIWTFNFWRFWGSGVLCGLREIAPVLDPSPSSPSSPSWSSSVDYQTLLSTFWISPVILIQSSWHCPLLVCPIWGQEPLELFATGLDTTQNMPFQTGSVWSSSYWTISELCLYLIVFL